MASVFEDFTCSDRDVVARKGKLVVLWCPVVFSLVWVLMKVLIYAENGIDCYLPLCVSTIC